MEGAGVRGREQPLVVPVRAGEGAAHMAEQFALQQALRNGRAVHRQEGTRGTRAGLVDEPGRQLLAGARFTADEYRVVGLGHGNDGAVQPLHGRPLSHQGGAAVLQGDHLPEAVVFRQQAAALQSLGRHPEQLVRFDGLGEKIVGPGVQGLDRDLDGAVSSEHHHAQIGVSGDHRFEQLHAAHLGHAQVSDQEVHLPLGQHGQGLATTVHRGHADIREATGQEAGQAAGEIRLVIHHHRPHALVFDPFCTGGQGRLFLAYHAFPSPSSLAAAPGSRTVNRAPPSSSDLPASTRPPTSVTSP